MNYHKLHVTACLLHASEIKKINETQEFGTRASTRTVTCTPKNAHLELRNKNGLPLNFGPVSLKSSLFV